MKFCRACREFIPNEQQDKPCPAASDKGPGANTNHRFNYEHGYESAASERLRSEPRAMGQHLQENIRQALRLDHFKGTGIYGK